MTLLEMILEYFSMVTDADVLYPKFLGVQLIGHILGKSSFVNVNPGIERLNMYVALIGESYHARKSVSQDLISELYPNDVLLPNETSAERFIANLADIPNGVWMYGEFSKILKHINKGGYLSTVAETLNDLYRYERPVYRRQIMKEEYEIKNPYPIFCTTLTPDVLKQNTDVEMLNGGLFGRLLLVPGTTKKKPRRSIPKEAIELWEQTKYVVNELYRRKIEGIEFAFTEDALKRLNEIEDELLRSKYKAIAGRYGQAMIKIAAILTFNDAVKVKISKNSIK